MKLDLLMSSLVAGVLLSGCAQTGADSRIKQLGDRVSAIEEQLEQMRVAHAGNVTDPGTREFSVTCKPHLAYERVRDGTRLGWHVVVWLVLQDGDTYVKIPWASGRGHSTPPGPVKLDEDSEYIFTVREITRLLPRSTNHIVRIAKGNETIFEQ